MLVSVDWTRKPRTYNTDGEYTDNPEIIMSDPMFASTGDEYFSVLTRDSVDTGLTKPYTYLWRREIVQISADGDELGSATWEVKMTQVSAAVSNWEESRNGGAFFPIDPPAPGTIAGLNWTFNFTNYSPGTYEFRGSFAVNGGPLSSEVLLGKFDLRALEIVHTGPTKPFDPQEEDLPIELTAQIRVLPDPGTGRVFPSGWVPDGPLTWVVNGSSLSSNTSHIFDTGTKSPAQETNIASEWDGRNIDLAYAVEPVDLTWQAVSAVPSSEPDAGNYYAETRKRVMVYHRKCECPELTGELQSSYDLSGGTGPVPLAATYLAFNGHRDAASMGSGWRLIGSAKLKQAASGDLIYTSESGHVLRWHEGVGGSYNPAREDNDVVAEAGGSAAFRLTFKGQSFRDFDSNGRVVADIDRNGNNVSYSYTVGGHLESVTDGRGRYFYFDYGSRTDGQPEQIRTDDPVTGRLIQLEYDVNDRLERITNVAGEVTEFEYDEEGLLSKETQVRPVHGDLVVEHAYNNLRQLSEQRLPGDLARIFSFDRRVWTVPIVDGEPDYESCGRTVDVARDSLGNTIYREENKPTGGYSI